MPVKSGHIWSLLLGLVCLGLLPLDQAVAQSSFQTVTTINPPPAAVAVPQRRRGAPVRRRATEEPTPTPPLRSSVGEPDADGTDPNGAGTTTEGDTPLRGPQDGDFTPPDGPRQPTDGVIPTGEPRAPVDGADPSLIDHRTKEERDRLRGRPAGFDPALFQVELEPVLDRRPRQLFRFEPYQPTGIRIGSFVALPEIEFAGAYFSNVFNSTRARSDVALDIRPAIRLVSNWRRHAAEFSARGTLTSFQEFDTENLRAYTIESRGRFDVSRRTSVEGLVSRDVSQETRSSIDANAAAIERPTITTDRVALTVNHRFNRLRLQLRGAVAETRYGDAITATGIVSNTSRDVTTTTSAVRASWEFKPALFAFVELAFDGRTYQASPSSDGIRRDSTGQRYRAGISFGNTAEILRGEISLGYGQQRPDDRRLSEIDGVLVDANLGWRITRLTSLMFTASTDFTDATVAGSPGAASYRAGLEIQHSLRRSLMLTAGIGRVVQKYEGISLVESEWNTTAGFDYFINRNVTLFGRYRHVAFTSDVEARNYNSDEVRIGVRWRR
ncbi:MAG: outer membrane beta-barrel protein [Hyphomicrobiaceae bacterium]|nr:outer membrane beta-barrel protein [Hyphomicrobiaceae bacterium]